MKDSADTVCELLAASLEAWKRDGRIERVDEGSILVTCNGLDIGIERAPPELPFRWMVSIAGRRRGAVSLVAVLRQLRAAIDPGYAADRARVVASPLLAP